MGGLHQAGRLLSRVLLSPWPASLKEPLCLPDGPTWVSSSPPPGLVAPAVTRVPVNRRGGFSVHTANPGLGETATTREEELSTARTRGHRNVLVRQESTWWARRGGGRGQANAHCHGSELLPLKGAPRAPTLGARWRRSRPFAFSWGRRQGAGARTAARAGAQRRGGRERPARLRGGPRPGTPDPTPRLPRALTGARESARPGPGLGRPGGLGPAVPRAAASGGPAWTSC